MSDRTRLSAAVFFYTVALILPLAMLFTTAAALLGWIDLETSAWALLALAMASFVIPFAIATAFLVRVESGGWFSNLLPYITGAVYALLPDPILFRLDDAAAVGLGALISTWLATRKNPDTPRWIIVPLLGAAVYTLAGGFLPGWLDEIIVDTTALLVAIYGMKPKS